MKYLTMVLMVLISIASFAQDIIYDVTPNEDSTSFRFIITDKSGGQPPYSAQDYNTLSKVDLQNTLYLLLEEQYNQLANAKSYEFFKLIEIEKGIKVLNDYDINQYQQTARNLLSKSFNGKWVYTVVGTPTNVNVTISDLGVFLDNNQIASIIPKSRGYITVEIEENRFDLYSENRNLFVGRNNLDQIVILKKE